MFIDEKARQLNIKVAYEGPVQSGKATCLEYIHTKIHPERRSRLVKLEMGTGDYLFFDFIPRSLPTIRGLPRRCYRRRGAAGGMYGVAKHEHPPNVKRPGRMEA